MNHQQILDKSLELKNSRCPKCNGRLFLSVDTYGAFEDCVFCGYQRDIDPPTTQEKIDWKSYRE